MTCKPGLHMYLAAGFFNESQAILCSFIERFETDWLPIYSPRNDGFVLMPEASDSEREEIFTGNVLAIEHCAFMLAVIDDFDTGVVWEMGYAFAFGTPVLAYSDVPGRGLNVMLAGGCALGFINGRVNLSAVLGQVGSGKDIAQLAPRNTWRGAIR